MFTSNRNMSIDDVYFKKIIKYHYREKNLQFRVAQDLFSSHTIDIGTQRLLRTLTSEKFNTFEKVLDLGSGYGPIGIALKSVCPSSVVHMVDRDALAIDYSHQNVALNNMKDITVYASLGYDEVQDTNFDLVVSNIPAKIGEPVLSHVLLDAHFHLRPGGYVAVVVTDTIAPFVESILKNKDNDIEILFHKTWPGHSVFHYRFITNQSIKPSSLSAFDRGVYDRGQIYLPINKVSFPIKTTYGLPEFTILSYETEMLLEGLQMLKNRNIDNALVFNSGQGFIPVALSKLTKVGKITLVDRDLESLQVSQRNLIENGYQENIILSHQVGIDLHTSSKFDTIMGILDKKDGPLVHALFVKQAMQQLAPKGLLFLVATSTGITRIESFVHSEKLLDIVQRKRIKGKSFIVLKKINE